LEANSGVKASYYGFIYEDIPGGDVRGFFWMGRAGARINISYEYRQSLAETNTDLLKEVKTCQKLTEAGNLVPLRTL
jgi:hypothetical protein